MKISFYFTLIIIALLSLVMKRAIAHENEIKKESFIPIETISAELESREVKRGSHININVKSILPDSCHTEAPTQVIIDTEKNEVLLQSQAYYLNELCAQKMKYSEQKVSLQLPKEGSYELFIQNPYSGTQWMDTIEVQ